MTYVIKGRAAHATPERAATFIAIVDAMRNGPVTVAGMRKATGMSATSVGKYAHDLAVNDVIRATGPGNGLRRYALNQDAGVVRAFVDALLEPGRAGRPHTRGMKPPLSVGRVHVMGYDEAYKVKVPGRVPPRHDPLMRAFYGMAA